MTQELTDHSANELAALIRDQAVSPVEVTRAFLERIERVNPTISAFVTVTAERALAEAAAAERKVTAGETLGPLHGVPVAIKELANTAGVRSTSASRAFADRVPDKDDEAIARLFRAGAVMLGKTNSPEFGLNATSEDGLYPATRNPWDVTRSAGGSSGGSGAALAARLCPFAEGSDGGGSIRIPAATNGVVGLKPARARVPTAPYAGELVEGFASSGPMARTVADVALGLDVMGGPAVGDPYPTLLPDRSFASAIGETLPRLRIAWTVTSPATTVEPEVAAAVERTAQALRDLGHELVEGAPDTSGMYRLWWTVANVFTAATPNLNPDLVGPNARASYDAGLRISGAEYLTALGEVYRTTRRVLAWFEDEAFDVLLCPTLPRTAPPLGELNLAGPPLWDALERYIPFTFWGNMTGQPAFSLPLAWSSAGLPIGVQLVGRQLAERTLITLAARLEEAFPWRDRRPAVIAS